MDSGRKRGRQGAAFSGNCGFKRPKEEMDSFTGVGSKSKACTKFFSTSPALFLQSQALFVPFENRTTLARAWADLHHFPLSKPLPCGDNCGVSINWHLFTNHGGGWSARITILNWDDFAFVYWFTTLEFEKAAPGFEAVYSFNGSALIGVNNTIFMHGLPGLNYLVAEAYGADPQKYLRVPGKQPFVISFTKKTTPGINIPGGDGFPSVVYFNGEGNAHCLKYFQQAVIAWIHRLHYRLFWFS